MFDKACDTRTFICIMMLCIERRKIHCYVKVMRLTFSRACSCTALVGDFFFIVQIFEIVVDGRVGCFFPSC